MSGKSGTITIPKDVRPTLSSGRSDANREYAGQSQFITDVSSTGAVISHWDTPTPPPGLSAFGRISRPLWKLFSSARSAVVPSDEFLNRRVPPFILKPSHSNGHCLLYPCNLAELPFAVTWSFALMTLNGLTSELLLQLVCYQEIAASVGVRMLVVLVALIVEIFAFPYFLRLVWTFWASRSYPNILITVTTFTTYCMCLVLHLYFRLSASAGGLRFGVAFIVYGVVSLALSISYVMVGLPPYFLKKSAPIGDYLFSTGEPFMHILSFLVVIFPYAASPQVSSIFYFALVAISFFCFYGYRVYLWSVQRYSFMEPF